MMFLRMFSSRTSEARRGRQGDRGRRHSEEVGGQDHEMGVSQDIPHGEGGEQGDPLMPLLFCLGAAQGFGCNHVSGKGGLRFP